MSLLKSREQLRRKAVGKYPYNLIHGEYQQGYWRPERAEEVIRRILPVGWAVAALALVFVLVLEFC